MKPRTIAVAGSFARLTGMLLGTAVMIVAVAEALNGICCAVASERDQ